MKLHSAIILGILVSAPPPIGAQEKEMVCETEGSTTTCVLRRDYKDCERTLLIAYGLVTQEAETRSIFSPADLAKAEHQADEFRVLSEYDRPRAYTKARAICLTK